MWAYLHFVYLFFQVDSFKIWFILMHLTNGDTEEKVATAMQVETRFAGSSAD